MTETDSQPIAENEQVKELLALLKDNNTPGYEEFAKLIEHVTGMEQRLLEATEELKAVRQEMQGLQNHSLKDALQKSYTAMEANISVMRHRLSELKGQIINGCRNILADFRERGTVALNGITQFLHVRPVLESIQSAAEKSMQASNLPKAGTKTERSGLSLPSSPMSNVPGRITGMVWRSPDSIILIPLGFAAASLETG